MGISVIALSDERYPVWDDAAVGLVNGVKYMHHPLEFVFPVTEES
ncbi:MAG: hypothetical protein Q7J84_18700 [Sulfuricaulis sp.]|nr:hypothetical protein [Sulfuricaulis sp.]